MGKGNQGGIDSGRKRNWVPRGAEPRQKAACRLVSLRPEVFATNDLALRKKTMRYVMLAAALVLGFALPPLARAADWPPQREKESIFTERKLETFKHGVRDE